MTQARVRSIHKLFSSRDVIVRYYVTPTSLPSSEKTLLNNVPHPANSNQIQSQLAQCKKENIQRLKNNNRRFQGKSATGYLLLVFYIHVVKAYKNMYEPDQFYSSGTARSRQNPC